MTLGFSENIALAVSILHSKWHFYAPGFAISFTDDVVHFITFNVMHSFKALLFHYLISECNFVPTPYGFADGRPVAVQAPRLARPLQEEHLSLFMIPIEMFHCTECASNGRGTEWICTRAHLLPLRNFVNPSGIASWWRITYSSLCKLGID